MVCIDTNDSDFNVIKKTGGEKKHILTVDEMPSHKHTIKYQNRTYSSGNNYIAEIAQDGIDYSTQSTGESQPHNNLQPYMVVYIWVRTK